MRTILLAAAASILVSIAMHELPAGAWDSFDMVIFEGRPIKVFRRGWPITYVVEGPLRDLPATIVVKLAANILSMALVFAFIPFAIKKLRAKAGRGHQREESSAGE